MRGSSCIKIVVLILVLAVGFALASGRVDQAYAATDHHSGHTGSYTGSHTGSNSGGHSGSYTGQHSGSYSGSYTGGHSGSYTGDPSHGHTGGHYSGGHSYGGHSYYSGGYYSGYYPYYSYWYYPYDEYCPYYYGAYCSPYYGSYYSPPSQYQLTVSTDPSSLSGQVTGGGSYNQGSSASFSASQNLIQVSPNTRYVFMGWSGDYNGSSLSGTVTMDSPKTVTANYQLQYYLTVTVQPSKPATPNGGGWYNAGDTVPLTISSQTMGVGDGTRLIFNGWSVDGNTQGGSVLNLQMNAPHTVTARYKQQYYLKIMTDQGVASGEGWYDAGTNAQISVSTPSSSYGVHTVFNGWQGDVQSSSQSTQVMMDGPKTVTATWRTNSTVLYETIAAILVAIALIAAVGFYSSRRRKRETSVMDSCVRCGRPIPYTNNYCASCGALHNTDATSSNSTKAPTR